jgi:ABC-type multidrug transport system fused ATPase/permease subunit
LPRWLEPTAGAILYDGVDMRELPYTALRRRIGFVLQQPYVFDDTIARNIAFGEEEARPRSRPARR